MFIAWDIGIKNLSYCLMDKKYTIIEWDIIDLTGLDSCNFLCTSLKKDGSACSKKASFINKLNTCDTVCKLHSKNKDYIPLFTCFKCKNTAKQRHVSTNTFYCMKHTSKTETYDTLLIKNIARTPLQLLGTLLINKLKSKPNILKANTIVLENQPVLKNPTMKSIQMILYTYYLIEKKGEYSISMISAKNKLKFDISNDKIKNIKKIKNKYQQNKKLAIEYCLHFLEKETDTKWLNYFKEYPNKKDDLADSYLLNRYSISKK